MDDNELDKLFGINGGDDGSGEDDSEHLQIVDTKEEKTPKAADTKDTADEEPSDEESAAEESSEASGDETSEEEAAEGEEKEQSETEGEEEQPEENAEEAESKADETNEESSGEKPSEEQDKKPKKKKKPKARLNGFGISVIVFFVLLVTLVLLFLFLPIFRVREVTVDGNVEMTDEEVLKEVGLEYNAHLMRGVSGNLLDILSLNYGKTEERIRRENPYIADITIAVRIPSEVRITVKERRKIAYVSTPDGYIALDRYGTVLEINSGKVKQDIKPIVYGISVESAKLGEKVKVRDETSYKRAIVVLGSILSADNATIGDKFVMFEHTTEVRILPSGYIFLTIYTESGKAVQVKLNKTDKINDKMTQLLFLFNSNAFDKITIKGTLDMTGDEYIFNPTTR
ncbi:MAG: FtsQ-type POTRA domain-containing protein [Clostridiales bacterium]|nr:FtsQ-type POTRA domain-containing protein [Clostridiales bacterium]